MKKNVLKKKAETMKLNIYRGGAMVAGIAATVPMFTQVAFAAEWTSDVGIAENVLKILAAIALISGILNGIIGGIHYAEAKGEGEGPAMAKAKGQIIAAIILAIIGGAILLEANTIAAGIASLLSF